MLPVCGKILERLIYYKMFEFFTENELISHNQSGFKPGDQASINYYVSFTIFINHSMMASRQEKFFLIHQRYLIKFGTRHEGLLFKLKQNGISGNLSHVITDFLY